MKFVRQHMKNTKFCGAHTKSEQKETFRFFGESHQMETQKDLQLTYT